MNIPVDWLNYNPAAMARGYADMGLLEKVFEGGLWDCQDGITFTHTEVDHLDGSYGRVVVVPCRHNTATEHVARLHAELSRLDWCLLILAGDEEWIFPWHEFQETSTCKVWVMQPRPEHAHLSGLIPGGWYPDTDTHLKAAGWKNRNLDWFFAGQVTHIRRQLAAKTLARWMKTPGRNNGYLYPTKGYLQGMPPATYFNWMAQAKIIPSPSGPMTPDTARTFEALEAGCIPIADLISGRGEEYDYWKLLFEGNRLSGILPRIWDWTAEFESIYDALIADWKFFSSQMWSAWQIWKRDIVYKFHSQIRRLALSRSDLPAITAIITASPIQSHPDTAILEETVQSIRNQLPSADILIGFDGVRVEQSSRYDDYYEHVRRVCWKANFEWDNVLPIVMDEWVHQADLTRHLLNKVRTPLVLFVEHDTPISGEIPWGDITPVVQSGDLNVVRFHHESHWLTDHDSIALDPHPVYIRDLPVRRTRAWWQRPHVARTAWYEVLLDRYIPFGSRTMIEDALYPHCSTSHEDNEKAAWKQWKVAVYSPEGNMQRSGHLDGRGDEDKYRMWLK